MAQLRAALLRLQRPAARGRQNSPAHLAAALILSLATLLSPAVAFAHNQTFNCQTDKTALNFSGTVTCSGATVIFGTSGESHIFENSTWDYHGETIFVVVTSSGTVGDWGINLGTTIDNFSPHLTANEGPNFKFTMTPGGGATAGDLFIVFNGDTYGGHVNQSDATIPKVCISDVSYADCGAGGIFDFGRFFGF